MGVASRIPPPANEIEVLIAQLERLRERVVRYAHRHQSLLLDLPEERRASAHNLLCYLGLRQLDLRTLQDRLAHLGLSSIGRAESNVLATLSAVLHNLNVLNGKETSRPDVYQSFDELNNRLESNTEKLFGPGPGNRRAHIMVTMPEAAADDYMMVHHLVKNGMDCIRVNCAHGNHVNWGRIIQQKAYAERVMGRRCPVLMDLRGPKMRTGPIGAAAAVLKIRPRRDEYGKVLRAARIWMAPDLTRSGECAMADACLAVDADLLSACRPGDRIELEDARGSRRRWKIGEVSPEGCWAEARKTTYLVNGTQLRLKGSNRSSDVRDLPQPEGSVTLRTGDVVYLTAHEESGKPAYLGTDGTQLRPGRIPVPVPEIFRDAQPGEPVIFDDCRISGIIEKRSDEQLDVRITHTRKPQEKLSSDKGLNLPETRLELPALSAEDVQDLDFVASNADMIGLSFTNTPEDVRELRQRLLALDAAHVGVVVKIETKRGFANLPRILIEALRFPACGVMIARGDLAAECGFERMAELQEEILWICEAAHVPVIWATQVLEGLTKRGHASRAEISDAAMGQSAECVMLNKGPYVVEAVRMLDDILRRMQDHQSKKRSMLRKLNLAI